MLLNDATAAYFGTTPVKAIYQNNIRVWPKTQVKVPPTRIAVSQPHFTGGTNPITLNVPAEAQPGDLIIMACTIGTGPVISVPAGWTVLCPLTTVNTRQFTVQARVRQAGDPSTYTWTVNAAGARTAMLVVVRGGPASTAPLVTSATWKRSEPSANTTAPGISAVASSLVLAIFGEATTLDEAAGFVPSYSNGFSPWGYGPQVGSSNIETVAFASKTPSAGPTGDTTATYQNPSLNGIAVQVAIPPA